jgi:CRISPR system Cascade subunit CasC
MLKPLFIQLHTLTSYPGTLLNRDDVGFAKRLPFGGIQRTRISSQCLKRHWRTFEGTHALSSLRDGDAFVELSVRSRHSFERFVYEPLVKKGIATDLARAATESIMAAVLGESAKAKKAKQDATSEEPGRGKTKAARKQGDDSASLSTGQITVLGKAELDFFFAEALALAKDAKAVDGLDDAKKRRFTKEWGKNLEGLRRAAGLDGALFGRMVTSDKLARCDAAVHVAHAFTVHAQHTETDYFAAVDDLLQGGDGATLGSGHIGTTELTSGLFYGYVVVDVAQLVSNVEGCEQKGWLHESRALASDVVASLVHLVARVSPGAKRGSTAPYAYAHMTMVEVGASQPRTLANAFLKPVAGGPDMVESAYLALASYVREVDDVFGLANRRALAAIGPKDKLEVLAPPAPLDAVAKFAARAIMEHA